MLLHFYLRYSTKFGQAILVTGNTETLGNDNLKKAFLLEYLNGDFWHGYVEIDERQITEPIRYKYILREDKAQDIPEFGDDRIIDTEKIKAERLVLTDTWNHAGTVENVFFSSAFKNILLGHNKDKESKKASQKFTHEFRVKSPLLQQDEILCLGGNAKILNDWDEKKVVPMSKSGNWFTVRLDLYKFFIFFIIYTILVNKRK